MKSSRKIWKDLVEKLATIYEKREAQNISYLLLEDLFKIKREDVLVDSEISLDLEELSRAEEELLKGCPIQYVTGTADFYGRKFKVKPGVLIPRPETEELVQLILDSNKLDRPRILDIGVGSGCIGITLSLELDQQVFGSEVSKEALTIAKVNSDGLGSNLQLIRHNILEQRVPLDSLDVIVSNPPYIPVSERQALSRHVKAFEPGLALFVKDEDPLVFYRRIAQEGKKSLSEAGKLYFEIHESFGSDIRELLSDIGYKDVTIHQDMQGKDRMVSATNSTNR